MDQIVIEGVTPYDGRYDLDWDHELTTRELGWIKRHAGYLPLELDERTLTDPELWCVLAAVAMRRAGRIGPGEVAAVFDRLADAPFGSAIRLETNIEEAEQGPPPPSSSSNGATSGDDSPTNSEPPANGPSPTGTPASGTSASGPPTSGT